MAESVSRMGVTRMVRSERNPRRSCGSSRTVVLFIPAGFFPVSLRQNNSLFCHVWQGRDFWLLRGLHACCMGCCGDDVGVSDYVSWLIALPNQKQDKWKSSKQSSCHENSIQHLSKDSVDYPESCSLGSTLLT